MTGKQRQQTVASMTECGPRELVLCPISYKQISGISPGPAGQGGKNHVGNYRRLQFSAMEALWQAQPVAGTYIPRTIQLAERTLRAWV